MLQHVGERRAPTAAGVMPRGVVRQLLQQEGIAARLARQREPLGRGEARLGGNQRCHDVPRLVLRHRLERQGGAGRRSAALQKRLQERLGGDLFRAQAGHHQEGRWVGRAQQGFEQAHAVRVGPVQVVDVQHERVPLRDPRQELAQRRERQAALRGWLRILRLVARRARHRLDLPHHGKRACQRAGLRRHERRRLRRRERAQVRTQTVDDPVERLVWHRLVLVTSAAKHHRIVAVRQLVEKLLDQRGLADSRGAVNADGRRTARL